MNKVFIPNKSAHDYSDAERFGTLITMSHGAIDKFNLTEMHRRFSAAMVGSTEDDFIVQSGPTIMLAVASALFASKHHRLNLLVWRFEEPRGVDHYVHYKLMLEGA